ncbi:MAG: hypothetical protein Q4A27_02440 [bacterium]|nr:hypothetical protein [bacterium]
MSLANAAVTSNSGVIGKSDCISMGGEWDGEGIGTNAGVGCKFRSGVANQRTRNYTTYGDMLYNIESYVPVNSKVCHSSYAKVTDSNGMINCQVKSSARENARKNRIKEDECARIGGTWWLLSLSGGDTCHIQAVGSDYKDTRDIVINTVNDLPDYYRVNSGDKFKSCKNGFNLKKDVEVTAKDGRTYRYSFCMNNSKLDDGGKPTGSTDSDGGDVSGNATEGSSSCAVDGIGWIVCPTTNFLGEMVGSTYKFIAENFLAIKSGVIFDLSNENQSKYKNNPGGGAQIVYQAWEIFRNLANVIFVILFTIVIISQITNIGISNYGIKKMLPRLIIFAILVNISYWVAVIFVDISNLLGQWIFNLFTQIGYNITEKDANFGQSITDGVSNVLAAGTVAGMTTVAMSGTLLVSLVVAALSILVMLAILTIRQAAVVILVVISPIAFAAAILPGTESIFNRWKNMLKGMLIVYPICSLMMGGMLFVSDVLVASVENDGNIFLSVMYRLIPVIGLGSVFMVIKGALAAIDKLTGGSITGKLNSIASGARESAAKGRLGKIDKVIGNNTKRAVGRFTGGGRFGRRVDRWVKANEESLNNAERDENINELGAKVSAGTATRGEELLYRKLQAEKQKEIDGLNATRIKDMSERFGSGGNNAYVDFAAKALDTNNGDELGIALQSLMSNSRMSGKDKYAQLTNIFQNLTKEQMASQSVKEAFTTLNDKYGGDIKANDPALMNALGDFVNGKAQDTSGADLYASHAGNADTYLNASTNDRAGWNQQTLDNINKYKANWTEAQQNSMAEQAAAVVGNAQNRAGLSGGQLEGQRKIAEDAGIKIPHEGDSAKEVSQAINELTRALREDDGNNNPPRRPPRRWR